MFQRTCQTLGHQKIYQCPFVLLIVLTSISTSSQSPLTRRPVSRIHRSGNHTEDKRIGGKTSSARTQITKFTRLVRVGDKPTLASRAACQSQPKSLLTLFFHSTCTSSHAATLLLLHQPRPPCISCVLHACQFPPVDDTRFDRRVITRLRRAGRNSTWKKPQSPSRPPRRTDSHNIPHFTVFPRSIANYNSSFHTFNQLIHLFQRMNSVQVSFTSGLYPLEPCSSLLRPHHRLRKHLSSNISAVILYHNTSHGSSRRRPGPLR